MEEAADLGINGSSDLLFGDNAIAFKPGDPDPDDVVSEILVMKNDFEEENRKYFEKLEAKKNKRRKK